MTHFHFYEDEAMHCNKRFCKLENRCENIMDVFAEIEDYKSQIPLTIDVRDETHISSENITKTIQEAFQIKVPEGATKKEHRAALFELAAMRWALRDPESENLRDPKERADLPQIYSFVDDAGVTTYFFNSVFMAMPMNWNPLVYERTTSVTTVEDNKIKIPVQKLPPAAAKKLFSEK